MKILLTSDSHRDVDYLYNTIVKENPDMVIFAGDHSDDAIDISYGFDIPFYIVRGNCDYYDNMTKDIIELEIEEVGKIFDVTRERIRQIEVKAINKLKASKKKNKLEEFRT